MSLPYFPMYPTDFEAKTSHLTLAEDGAYNRLLRLMWMTPGCTLPADHAWLMRRLRVDEDTFFTVVKVVLDEFFTVKNGRLSNAKLSRIFAETSVAHQKRVSAGSKGGKAKSLKTLAAASSNATAMPKQPEPEPELDIRKKEDTNVSLCNTPPAIDEIAQAVSAYNGTAERTGWPKIQTLSPARRKSLRARLSDAGGVTGWEVALSKAEASSFLTGRTDRPFTATFDFIVKPANFTKIMEGNYDDRANATGRADQHRGPSGFAPTGGRGQDASIASIVARRRAARG
jgi:uncharacterized protein YdaU (DUF1376 family)